MLKSNNFSAKERVFLLGTITGKQQQLLACAKVSGIDELIIEWESLINETEGVDFEDPSEEDYRRLPRRVQKIYDAYRNNLQKKAYTESYCIRALERNLAFKSALKIPSQVVAKTLNLDRFEVEIYFNDQDPYGLSLENATNVMKFFAKTAASRGMLQKAA